MKIVDRKKFLAMPAGTVFAKYAPCYFEELQIKEETWPEIGDYLYAGLVCEFQSHDSGEHSALLQESEDNGVSIPLDMNVIARDGCFDEDQLFAVYDRADVEALIARLQEALA